MRIFIFLSLILSFPSIAQFHYQVGKIYGESSKMDHYEVISLVNLLVESTLEKNLRPILEHIHPKEGIYIDIHAKWSKVEFLNDLNKRDGYLAKFYFLNTNSVYKTLKSSEKYIYHIFFEGDECHVQIEFGNNKDNQYNLNNPILKKVNGKWYLLRIL